MSSLDLSLVDVLLATTERDGEAAFLHYGDMTMTYAAFVRQMEATAQSLREAGVTPGENVLLVAGTTPDFLLWWFAVNRIGAVAVPVDVALVGAGLRHVVSDSGAALVVGEREVLDAKRADYTLDEQLSVMTELGDPAAPPGGSRRGPEQPLPGTLPATVLYTSGTTGPAKGVVLPHHAYVAAGNEMVRAVGVTRQDRIMVVLPLFHANPQMYAVAAAVVGGASLILIPKFSASRFWADAEYYRATAFTYVGTVLSILAATTPERPRHSLRYCTGGGAPADVWAHIEDELGIAVHELYGMTETGGYATISTREHRRRGACGRVRPDMQLAVVDDADRPVPPGQEGQIVLRPVEPHVMFSGYHRRAESTLASYGNLWFHTGDLGHLDEDGFLHFHARSTAIIRRGGQNISPSDVERALAMYPGVEEAAVVGVPDDVMGQEVKAVLVLESGCRLDVADLRSFLRAEIAAYAIPRYVEVVDRLPKTATQKVLLRELTANGPAVVDAGASR
jgi:acyl-CoA synthetase (AMP-forming)/AMP-acid ligase II